jgi:hypothetical protein
MKALFESAVLWASCRRIMVGGLTSDMLNESVVAGRVANRRIGRRKVGKLKESGAEAYRVLPR